MNEAHLAAATAFLGMLLYGYRSGTVLVAAGWGERLARLSVVALLAFLGVAYLDVAAAQDRMLWRQWLVFAALIGVTAGHAALLWRLRGGRDQYR